MHTAVFSRSSASHYMKNKMDYDAFIAQKVKRAQQHGFTAAEIKAPLFEWQKLVVKWALKQGKAIRFGPHSPALAPKALARSLAIASLSAQNSSNPTLSRRA